VDLEDGFRMGYIAYEDARMLSDILVGENLDGIGCKKRKYKVREKAIHKLITEVKQVFLDYENEFL